MLKYKNYIIKVLISLGLLCFLSDGATVAKGIVPQSWVFGRSVANRPMVAYVLGSGSDTTMIFGAFHGDEHNTPDAVFTLIKHLKEFPEILRNHTVVLVPIANPDGWVNRTRFNSHGVDLNRNFPVGWMLLTKSARFRSGPRPESEPETKAIIALLVKFHPDKVISIHQPLERMIYTGTKGLQLARAMQSYVSLPITDHSIRSTPGSFGLYCGNGLHIAIVTLELGPTLSPKTSDQVEQALTAAIGTPVGGTQSVQISGR